MGSLCSKHGNDRIWCIQEAQRISKHLSLDGFVVLIQNGHSFEFWFHNAVQRHILGLNLVRTAWLVF